MNPLDELTRRSRRHLPRLVRSVTNIQPCACGCGRDLGPESNNTRYWSSACKDRARRARHHGRPRWPSEKDRTPDDRAMFAVLRSDPCCYCGSRDRMAIDHIVPRSRGGALGWGNCTAACRACNSAKHDRSLLVFLLERGPR